MLTLKKINKIYERIVKLAIKSEKNPEQALDYIIIASKWMYKFNSIYSDDRLDNLLKRIANINLPQIQIIPDKSKVCFIDYFGWDNRGLTQQYLRGLMASDKEILYILHSPYVNNDSEIIHELQEYSKAKIIIKKEKRNTLIPIASEILLEIQEFSPNDILVHIAPWDVVSILCLASVNGSTIYNINLTDHAFWLGASLMDYNIEFRSYGQVVSEEKRGFNPSQLILLPYYPIISKYTGFDGFPDLPKNAIKVLCGGSEYKMLGQNGFFFQLMQSVLKISPRVHILVAGIKPKSTFGKEVDKMIHKDRVHFIGTRKDIAQVFANIDIYLSSYPFLGGLMCQYAALFSKPILSYNKASVIGNPSDVINHHSEAINPQFELDGYVHYATRLINDNEYRKSEGEAAKKTMIEEDEFNKELITLLNKHTTKFKLPKTNPDYDYIIKSYIEIENINKYSSLKELFENLRLKSFLVCPHQFLKINQFFVKKIINKFKFVNSSKFSIIVYITIH